MQSDWAARRYPGRIFQGGQKIARAARRPTPSRARRTPRGAAATSLTLRAPGLVGTGGPRTAPAAAGQHQGPTQRLPGPRRQARPTYLQRLLLRPRPEPPPWWSPGPAFSRPPSLWRPTALVRAGEAGERRGPEPASEQRRGPRVAVRSGLSPPQDENNTTATWPRRSARREEGGRKSWPAAGGRPRSPEPDRARRRALRGPAPRRGFRRARRPRIPTGGTWPAARRKSHRRLS